MRKNCLENLEDFLRERGFSQRPSLYTNGFADGSPDTTTFVDDVFNAIRTKSYLPGYSAPPAQPPTGPAFNPPTGPANASNGHTQSYQNGSYNGTGDPSRKRTYNDRAGSEPQDGRDPHYGRNSGGERAMKQMRRGGGNNRGMTPAGRGGWQGSPHNRPPQPVPMAAGLPGLGSPSMPQMPAMPPMPTPPPGMPQIDPNNPLSALLAMSALGFPPLPGMPALPLSGSPTGFAQNVSPDGASQTGSHASSIIPPKKVGERCRDYDTKGFCVLGSICPYEHGQDPVVVSGQTDGMGKLHWASSDTADTKSTEYDPNNASMIAGVQKAANGNASSTNDRGGDSYRGRGRGRGDRGGHAPGGRGGRASFSHAGPMHDRSITTIVVEQIPEERFDEQSVRDFFSEFGNIAEVQMQAYKRLALVKYDDYYAARRAYQSPKSIFDNRFVKVYWYKPETLPTPPEKGAGQAEGKAGSPSAPDKMDDDMIDPVEFEKRQAEAQKAHEEKQKRLKEAEGKKREVEQKLKEQAEERRKLLEKLAAKSATKAATTASTTTGADIVINDATPDARKSAQTDALRAKLAELEAEAESMGLNPNEPWTAAYGRGGRGGYRGRGGYVPRGRGHDPYRGSYRGRAAYGGVGGRGGAVMRLDNRTKKVAVAGVEPGTAKDEKLRQHLFVSGFDLFGPRQLCAQAMRPARLLTILQNNYEIDSYTVEPHPDRKDAQIVTFKERYVAESVRLILPRSLSHNACLSC